MPYFIPSFLNMNVPHYSVYIKAVYNQTSSTIFPYQVLERRQAQEIVTSCAGLQKIKYSKEHSKVYKFPHFYEIGIIRILH
jgi:hypothetical protein